ncbi:class I SAM-dependent methyltransferase [Paeniclostridium hominis]|uniref:class I SAM-dependent methyltransferase n=1 Tax=Paeniclostridium hominis TaxID=2764329 RepID=UPI0022E7F09D|nr:class I SAM-dependent methyltransferase [Paeniclostridium hominis]
MDNKYWNDFYNKDIAPKEASKFANDIIEFLEMGKSLVELGCGNGRDAKFFSRYSINITAIDQSEAVILKLNDSNKQDNLKFICDDFVNSNLLDQNKFDYAYSRFTIHSITEEEETILVKRVYNSLKSGGMFFIEVRSVKDELYGLGKNVGRNAYIYNEHYRRFIIIDELVQTLKEEGFKIISAKESSNWAIYKDLNPVVIRIIAKKDC